MLFASLPPAPLDVVPFNEYTIPNGFPTSVSNLFRFEGSFAVYHHWSVPHMSHLTFLAPTTRSLHRGIQCRELHQLQSRQFQRLCTWQSRAPNLRIRTSWLLPLTHGRVHLAWLPSRLLSRAEPREQPRNQKRNQQGHVEREKT